MRSSFVGGAMQCERVRAMVPAMRTGLGVLLASLLACAPAARGPDRVSPRSVADVGRPAEGGQAYLTPSDIERLVIGKALKEASTSEWKESFLPGDAEARRGSLVGRSKSEAPYVGSWALDAEGLCVDYGDGASCYRLTMEQENQVLWFDRAGALTYRSYLVEPDRPEDFAPGWLGLPFANETVTFWDGKNTLAADLSMPGGPAPHPAIVFVHGAGPTSRRSSYYEPIRDEFLRRGFATLIWSKPGVDESTGDYLEQSVDDRAAEVEAAMSYLATRSELDRDRIGLWAGSQAGWVVPKVAARREIAFVILVACPADDVVSQDLYLARNFLALLGLPGGEHALALDEVRSFHELIRADGSYEEFSKAQESLLARVKARPWHARVQPPVPEAWFLRSPHWFVPTDRRTFRFLHTWFVAGPPRLEALRSPLLAIYGTKDLLVDWKLGSSAYERVPELAGNPDVAVVLFEGADHSLMQPDLEGYLAYAPGYLTTMGEWLSKHR